MTVPSFQSALPSRKAGFLPEPKSPTFALRSKTAMDPSREVPMSKLHRHLHRLAGRPREPRPKAAVHTAVDRTTPVVLPPVRERWDVVMLSPAANEGTLARINAAGFDVWRPRAVVLVSSATLGKAAWVNRPLWPRYAFVGRRDATGSLCDVWSIGKPLTVGTLSGAVVEALAQQEARGDFDPRTRPAPSIALPVGAEVEALDGLMSGIVQKSDDQRTVVLFRLMERDHVVVVDTARLRVRA